MTILGFMTLAVMIGAVLLMIVGIWLLVDLFLIPGMVQQQKDVVRQRLSANMVSTGSVTA
jgi:uncharacterized membrane protein